MKKGSSKPISNVTNITSHKYGLMNPIKNNTNEIKKYEPSSCLWKYYDVLQIMSSFKRYFLPCHIEDSIEKNQILYGKIRMVPN